MLNESLKNTTTGLKWGSHWFTTFLPSNHLQEYNPSWLLTSTTGYELGPDIAILAHRLFYSLNWLMSFETRSWWVGYYCTVIRFSSRYTNQWQVLISTSQSSRDCLVVSTQDSVYLFYGVSQLANCSTRVTHAAARWILDELGKSHSLSPSSLTPFEICLFFFLAVSCNQARCSLLSFLRLFLE